MGNAASRPEDGDEPRPPMFSSLHNIDEVVPPFRPPGSSLFPASVSEMQDEEGHNIPRPSLFSTHRHLPRLFASNSEEFDARPARARQRAHTLSSSQGGKDGADLLSVSSEGVTRGPDGRKKAGGITSATSNPNLDKHDEAVQRCRSKVNYRDTNKVREGVDEEGNKMINQYSMICVLGKGAYGKVKLAMDVRTNQPFAIKIMSKSQLQRMRKNNGENAMDDVRKEVAIMKKLTNKNVVRLFEVIDDPNSDKIFLVLEYLPNGPIIKVLPTGQTNGALSEEKARGYFRDALSGLSFLHAQGIIHRDIKPENLLLDADNCVKITDFGVSQFIKGNDDTVEYMAGTPAFLAPEAVSQERFAGKPCDIWALGVSLYALIFGCLPFISDNYVQMYEMIKAAEIQYPKPVSASLQDLFSKVLERDPQQRITLSQLHQHLWVTSDGELPMELPKFERLHITDEEVSNAITKIRFVDRVALMVKVKGRFRKKAEEARERTRNRASPEPTASASPQPSSSTDNDTTPSADSNWPNSDDATTFATSTTSTSTPIAEASPSTSLSFSVPEISHLNSAHSSPLPPSPLSANSWSASTPTSPQSH